MGRHLGRRMSKRMGRRIERRMDRRADRMMVRRTGRGQAGGLIVCQALYSIKTFQAAAHRAA